MALVMATESFSKRSHMKGFKMQHGEMELMRAFSDLDDACTLSFPNGATFMLSWYPKLAHLVGDKPEGRLWKDFVYPNLDCYYTGLDGDGRPCFLLREPGDVQAGGATNGNADVNAPAPAPANGNAPAPAPANGNAPAPANANGNAPAPAPAEGVGSNNEGGNSNAAAANNEGGNSNAAGPVPEEGVEANEGGNEGGNEEGETEETGAESVRGVKAPGPVTPVGAARGVVKAAEDARKWCELMVASCAMSLAGVEKHIEVLEGFKVQLTAMATAAASAAKAAKTVEEQAVASLEALVGKKPAVDG